MFPTLKQAFKSFTFKKNCLDLEHCKTQANNTQKVGNTDRDHNKTTIINEGLDIDKNLATWLTV